MLSKHLTPDILRHFQAGRLSLRECLTVESHLRVCPRCASRLEAHNDYQLWALEEAGHPDLERELAPFAYRKLAGPAEEYVQNHILDCPTCREEITALRRQRDHLRESAQRLLTITPDSEKMGGMAGRWRAGWLKRRATRREKLPVAPVLAALMVVCLICTAGLGLYYFNPLRDTLALCATSFSSQSMDWAQLTSPGWGGVVTGSPKATPSPSEVIAKLSLPTAKPATNDELTLLPPALRRQTQALLSGPTPAALSSLRPEALTLRGPGQPQGALLRLMEPLGQTIVNEQPTLRWKPVPGATSYTVSVSDSRYNEVANSGPQATTSFRVPQLLARGQIYLWRVTAKQGEEIINAPVPPAPPAMFRVADAATTLQIRRLQGGRVRLPLILYCLRQGLLDEAQAELRQALRQQPGSRLYLQLWRRVQALSAGRKAKHS